MPQQRRYTQAEIRRNRIIALVILVVAVVALAALVTFIVRSCSQPASDMAENPTASELQDTSNSQSEDTGGPTTTLTISFAGDCTLGTDEAFDYASSLNAKYESAGAEYFLQNVKDIFEADDYTIANCEGPLSANGERADKTYCFYGEKEFASIFSEGGVDAVTMANNHAFDYGMSAYKDTKKALKKAGVTSFAYDRTAVVEVKGVRIGLMGIYAMDAYERGTEVLQQDLQALESEDCDLLIAYFHWDNEGASAPNDDTVELAHKAVDWGVDVVIGSHPHVLQGVELYHGSYIAYSMGNFCFGGNSNPSDYDTMILQVTLSFENGELAESGAEGDIAIIPCSVSSESGYNDYQPTPAEGSEAKRITKKVNERSGQLDGDGVKF